MAKPVVTLADIQVVLPSRYQDQYHLQVAFQNRMYWFKVPTSTLGNSPSPAAINNCVLQQLQAYFDNGGS